MKFQVRVCTCLTIKGLWAYPEVPDIKLHFHNASIVDDKGKMFFYSTPFFLDSVATRISFRHFSSRFKCNADKQLIERLKHIKYFFQHRCNFSLTSPFYSCINAEKPFIIINTET